MSVLEKEIIYKFQSSGFEIYKDSSKETYLIMKHCCSDCHQDWFTNKEQCIFCGSIGYNVEICDKLHISAIAGSKDFCGYDGCTIEGKDLVKSCINSTCDSNLNINLKKIINQITKSKSKGVGIFSANSPFCISQATCFFCGSSQSEFIINELDIKNINDITELTNVKNNFSKDILIVRFNKKFLTKIKNIQEEEDSFLDDINLGKILEKMLPNLLI